MRRLVYIVLITLVMLTIAIIAMVINNNNLNTENSIKTQSDCQIKDYENGVIYFDCIDTQFVTSLSNYIHEHQNITTLSISGTDQDFYGADRGYIVVTHEL